MKLAVEQPVDISKTAYQTDTGEVFDVLNSSPGGLSSSSVTERLQQYGTNTLPEKKGKSAFLRFIAHFNDVLIYILLAAVVLTLLMAHWVDSVIILCVVFVNALIGFIQENNAEKSLKSIQNMLSNQVQVLRDGSYITIESAILVPGDIVRVKAGDKVPADLRIFEAHNLQVEEAILTGESTVVSKNCQKINNEVTIGDRINMLFSGTTISAGSGIGIVVATGEKTELGHINQMMADVKPQPTPLLVQINKLGKIIFIAIMTMIVALFIFSVILRDIPLPELLLSLISLAVASVPEGLPAIISIILSLGVQSIAQKKAIIRKLPTVETLGAMNIICSDKTGTLTMNEMTVKSIIMADHCYHVDGNSYEPVGNIYEEESDVVVQIQPNTALHYFLSTVDICNESHLSKNAQGHWIITGGPTEGALKVLAAKAHLPQVNVNFIAKIPFDSTYKYMANLVDIAQERVVLMTGAPDVLLRLCKNQLTDEGIKSLDEAYWHAKIAQYAKQGLRMVAAAYKEGSSTLNRIEHHDLNEGMIFIGLAGMMDPPRPEAIDAIEKCQQAGISVKMITGDHPETAMAIGQMLGITNSNIAITGNELEHMDDIQLQKVGLEYSIFARTSPEHKLRLVKALQSQQQIVGMTGDGVNDAPALKQADVGIAMGIKGTEVTKEAADMILTDDNFATIANAVKEGRRVYDNLVKTILFIMPTNLAQGLLIIIALLAGNLIPLTPVLILWMNMATSITLSFGLAFERAESNIMNRPPRQLNKHVMDLYAVWRIVFVGILIAISTFTLENWLQPRGYSDEFIRTVLLQTLVTAQWIYMINCRSTNHFSLDRGLLQNKGIFVVSIVLFILQLAIIYLPFMNVLFGTEALPVKYWLIAFAISVVIFLLVEIEKLVVTQFIRKK